MTAKWRTLVRDERTDKSENCLIYKPLLHIHYIAAFLHHCVTVFEKMHPCTEYKHINSPSFTVDNGQWYGVQGRSKCGLAALFAATQIVEIKTFTLRERYEVLLLQTSCYAGHTAPHSKLCSESFFICHLLLSVG